LNLKDDLFKAQQGKEDLEKIGFEFIFEMMAKASTKEMQTRIYDCLAEPFEISSEEVGKLAVAELINNFMFCFDLSTLKTFIKRASS
jgi:hypothetical protein